MKKIALFVLSVAALMFLLSHLPSVKALPPGTRPNPTPSPTPKAPLVSP